MDISYCKAYHSFNDIAAGKTFLYEDELFIKITRKIQYTDSYNYQENAVKLKTGEICSFEQDDNVVPVEARIMTFL